MKEKTEWMTNLRGSRLVHKTDGRITFRGLIDTLEAEVIEAQVLAAREHASENTDGINDEKKVCLQLDEVLDYLRAIMAAEVKETPLNPPILFGMDSDELHKRSHEVFPKDDNGAPLFPSYTQGAIAARINTLRAKVREAELFAVSIFTPPAIAENGKTCEPEASQGETIKREDIVLGLNRLSSALWWLYCDYII